MDINVLGIVLQGQATLHKTLHDGACEQTVGIAVDIVPHHELVEGEESEDALVQHFPAWLAGNGLADSIEDLGDIYAVLVGRQCVEVGNEELILLSQELNERDVQNSLLITHANEVAGAVADDVDGQEKDRSQTRLVALLGDKPAEHTNGDEEGVGAVLFHCCARAAIKVGQDGFQLRGGEGSGEGVTRR